ncbi:hypothetical protein [Streptomyces sp. SAS_270]|uniref:hypothetical protein n=1 Tax=Streptomyces sp. SAS_270 TaxID=3412748 RepID=UPI00403C7C68
MRTRSRLAPLALAAVGAGLVLATSTPASASDDWHVISGWSGLATKRPTGWMAYPESPSGPAQAEGWGRVDWTGTDVEVHTGAADRINDGWCAITQLRYHVKVNGAWKSDWQYRSPAVDCDINDGQVISKYYASNYPIKDVHFQVCLGWRDGTTFQCPTNWH